MPFKPSVRQRKVLDLLKRWHGGFKPTAIGGIPVGSQLRSIELFAVARSIVTAEIGESSVFLSEAIADLCRRGYVQECEEAPRWNLLPLQYMLDDGVMITIHDKYYRRIEVERKKMTRWFLSSNSGFIRPLDDRGEPRNLPEPPPPSAGVGYTLLPRGYELVEPSRKRNPTKRTRNTHKLTAREKEVQDLLEDGLNQKEIAIRLELTEARVSQLVASGTPKANRLKKQFNSRSTNTTKSVHPGIADRRSNDQPDHSEKS